MIAAATGSFQDELGCPGDWQPSCLRTSLRDADGDGTYVYSTEAIPPGSYEFEVALYEVGYSCTDDQAPDPRTEATLDGLRVEDGDTVFLRKTKGATGSRWRKGILRIKAPDFELVVGCADEAGNESEVNVDPNSRGAERSP